MVKIESEKRTILRGEITQKKTRIKQANTGKDEIKVKINENLVVCIPSTALHKKTPCRIFLKC